jgi:hypothetical protein
MIPPPKHPLFNIAACQFEPQFIHSVFVPALALTGRDTEAREALHRYLALPSIGPLKTVAAFKAYWSAQGGRLARVEATERVYDGLRKAGMPDE